MTVDNKTSWSNTPQNQIILIKAVKNHRPFSANHGCKDMQWDKVVGEVNKSAKNTITRQTAKQNFNRLYETFLKENPMDGSFYSGTVTLENSVSQELQVVAGEIYTINAEKAKCKAKKEILFKRKEDNFNVAQSMLELSIKKLSTAKKTLLTTSHNQTSPSSSIDQLEGSNLLEAFQGEKVSSSAQVVKKRKMNKPELLDFFLDSDKKNTAIGEGLLEASRKSLELKQKKIELDERFLDKKFKLKEEELAIRRKEVENNGLIANAVVKLLLKDINIK
jgi:hypothetical protein